jgi:uncharacterized protein YndB with AHSA1/START domain
MDKHALMLRRELTVPASFIWRGYTEPELLKKWFCPLPWRTTDCRMDLKPGGEFYTYMQGPAGETMPGTGCYLEIVSQKKLVWTSALLPGYVPQPVGEALGFHFTAIIELTPTATGCIYQATVLHADETTKQKHADMGFTEGWGAALDQLVALYNT